MINIFENRRNGQECFGEILIIEEKVTQKCHPNVQRNNLPYINSNIRVK